MRYYLIDEISKKDMEKINIFLTDHAVQSEMEGLFWVQIPESLLGPVQTIHRECQPYQFAVELGMDWLKAEFFIRSQGNLRCTCPAYCTHEQGEFILQYLDKMIQTLDIRT
ncbi:MAG: hypothetical protein JW932_17530 [Deltaproteobacteria bacterium]|nr:hypothetical protein [Deltaproteobacteria bacterium]